MKYHLLPVKISKRLRHKYHSQPSTKQTDIRYKTVLKRTTTKWAPSWENLFLPYANNKGADQPAHSRSLISAFVVRCLDSILLVVSISEISAEQAALSLTWSKTPKTGFFLWRSSNIKKRVIYLARLRNRKESGQYEGWSLIIALCHMSRLRSESSLSAHAILLVLSWGGSYNVYIASTLSRSFISNEGWIFSRDVTVQT